ncbi:hypothetical protein OOJ09_23515 [Mesorhizobium qingshengii]|uniref:Transcriptional regulatory protein, C terminal n=1 Tax=Mesorhizobium qingshengii TaxID=1165689 RepID=A0ABT4QZZ6_9HYPH|nr:hypothetical protein [Mesorhizobium qingshengii]MCZ8547169.1 hypothetical protein [Mesorhizobium qingshengii]
MTVCPCCKAAVTVEALDNLITSHEIRGLDRAVLQAVWRGRGMPVTPNVLFDAMYADDPDGGPSPTRMYIALKKSLSRLEVWLEGSGVSIVEAGFRQGYRLAITTGE